MLCVRLISQLTNQPTNQLTNHDQSINQQPLFKHDASYRFYLWDRVELKTVKTKIQTLNIPRNITTTLTVNENIRPYCWTKDDDDGELY